MGYSTRNNGAITDFWPDNDENTLYLTGPRTLAEIHDLAREHFGNRFKLGKIEIEPEYIHTSCLYYDQHDSSDWTNFLKITLL